MCVTDLIGWRNVVTRLVQAPKMGGSLGLSRKQTVAIGPKGQGGLIMRILRRPLMILVIVVLRMKP
jgi:hypothetical protein